MTKHEHQWQEAIKRITITNDSYEGGTAYLKVRYCPKCKSLVGMDYWQENIEKGLQTITSLLQ